MKVQMIQAKWVLGELATDTLPSVAADLLGQGLDTPSLRQLASLVAPTWFEVQGHVDDLFREMGLDSISPQTAWLRLARDVAEQVTEGRIAPEIGAGRLAHLGLDEPYQQHAGPYAESMFAFELLIVDKEDFSDSDRVSIKELASNFLEQTNAAAR